MRHGTNILRASLAALAASVTVSVHAAGTPAGQAGGMVVPLYPKGTITPLPTPEIREDPLKNGQINIRNVSAPTLEVFRPAAGKGNGTAIIVVPGGGFVNLVYDLEGTSVARRLAAEGITAFVLKYRVVQTDPDLTRMPDAHMKEMGVVMSRATSGTPAELPRFAGEPHAVEDAAQAIRLVRGKAAEWGYDAGRVGMIGFSAGAFTTADLAIGDKAVRPAFVGLIYGGLRTPVPRDAPPAFIATAADDQFVPNDPVQLYTAWKAAGRPAELHIFESGKHGFGTNRQGTSSDGWFDEFTWWLRARGLMTRTAT